MTVRLITAGLIAWALFRAGFYPVETLIGVVALVIVGYAVDLIIRREGREP